MGRSACHRGVRRAALSIREKLHPEHFTSVLAAGALSSPRRRGAPSRMCMCFVPAPTGIFGKDAHDGLVGLVQRLSVPSPTGAACPRCAALPRESADTPQHGDVGGSTKDVPEPQPGRVPSQREHFQLGLLGVPRAKLRHTEPFFSSLWLHEQLPCPIPAPWAVLRAGRCCARAGGQEQALAWGARAPHLR